MKYGSKITVEKLLAKFYKQNGIPADGGVNKDTFEIKVLGIHLKLPKPKFRKDVMHIHDIHHILNKQNTT